MEKRLLLVLGDQLTPDKGALSGANPESDVIVMAEVAEEATYVRHNRHKMAFIFAAMRHFRDEMRECGFEVIYFDYDEGLRSLEDAVQRALADPSHTGSIDALCVVRARRFVAHFAVSDHVARGRRPV